MPSPGRDRQAAPGCPASGGADFEILGATGEVPGGAFLYTNADTVAIGVVLRLTELARCGRRPEELIADVKARPAIAQFVAGAELKEFSAHLIPEGGYDFMPDIASDGITSAPGDAARPGA